MLNAKSFRFSPTLLALCLLATLSLSALAQQGEEAALVVLIEKFYTACAQGDGAAMNMQGMEDKLAACRGMEIKSLRVRKLKVEGEKARALVSIEHVKSEAKDAPANEEARVARLLMMNRIVYLVRAGERWSVQSEAQADADLAARLLAAKSLNERAALLNDEGELMTTELSRALLAAGDRRRTQRDFAGALAAYQLAGDISAQLHDSEGIAAALNGSGVIARLQGNFKQAQEFLQKSLSLFETLKDKAGIARVLNNLGAVYYRQGDYALALEHYRRSLTLSDELNDKAGSSTAVNNIGLIHRAQGDYMQALLFYQKSLKLSEELGDRSAVSDTLNNIGIIHRLQGDFTQALSYYRRSLEMREAAGDKSGVAQTLNSIGNVYLLQGNYARALDYYQRVLALREEQGDKPNTAIALNNIGIVYRSQGDYAQALSYFQKSLSLYEAIGDKSVIAAMLNNMGEVHLLQGDEAQALEFLQRSLRINDALGNKEGIADTQKNMGDVERWRGNDKRALEAYEKALALRQALGKKEGSSELLNSIARMYLKQSDAGKALNTAQSSIALAREVNSPARLREALVTLGEAELVAGRADEARRAFDEAINTIEAMRYQVAGGELQQERFFEDKLSPYHAMVELLLQQGRAGEALVYAERARARVLVDVLRNGRVDVTKRMTAVEQLRDRELNNALAALNMQLQNENARRAPDASRINELTSRLAQARLEYEAFQTRLYAAHPLLKVQRGEASPLGLREAANLLPDAGVALLEYVVTEEKTLLFVLTGSARAGQPPSLSVYQTKIKRRELVERVEQFRQKLSRRDLDFRGPARELYDLLLGQARTQLEGKRRLVIVPDDVLWDLPFQALQPADQRYLLEDFAISYAPSLTALREMENSWTRKATGAKAAHTLLAIGNPALARRAEVGPITSPQTPPRAEGFEPLPQAEREVRTLAQFYGPGRSRLLTGPQALEELVKAEAAKFSTLHLATHGVINDASPMYSYLLLAQPGKGSEEDGLLEAWEMMKLDLSADLIVLSACETARGRVRPGEGVVGLSWALFVAGSRTAVLSQWKVESASTTELMLDFHRNLTGAGRKQALSKAEALRQAALKMKRGGQYAHPFYWAGFVMMGDAR